MPIFIAGPTAVGKSAAALLLARELAGEIISVDSMQVYRGLNIGTAKPSSEERAQVPHHLLDVVALNESFDAACFIRRAREACEGIYERGRIPIFCGGTGLYFKAWLEGLGDSPRSDTALRAELAESSVESLLEELREKDPVTYERIDQQNPRRILRAVEVIRLTGKPISQLQATWSQDRVLTPGFFFLHRHPADAIERIQGRVDTMFHQGWVDETRRLRTEGLEKNPTAMQAIGYRQILEHLEGKRNLSATQELVRIRTRQYARRQSIWFRRHGTAKWMLIGAHETPTEVAARLVSELRAPSAASLSPPAL